MLTTEQRKKLEEMAESHDEYATRVDEEEYCYPHKESLLVGAEAGHAIREGEVERLRKANEFLKRSLLDVEYQLVQLASILRKQKGRSEALNIAEHDACLVASGFISSKAKQTVDEADKILEGK